MKKLPHTYNQKFGGLKTTKGNWDGKQVMTWDSIPKCREDDCPSFDDCYLPKSNHPQHTRCLVMSNYLRGVYSIMVHNYDLSEPDLMRVGMHLIPLYKNLCRLQIEEHGLRDLMRTNKAGSITVHPLYDAIRNHILTIDRLWAQMAFDKKYGGRKDGKKGSPQMDSVDDLIHGDGAYYEGLNDDENATDEAEI